MTDFDREKLEQELEAWSAEIFAKRSTDAANNEYSTRTYLIESFLQRFVGANSRDSSQVAHEFKIQDHKGGLSADYVLNRDGEGWCAIEAKTLGSSDVTGQVNPNAKGGWQQLDAYARSRELSGATCFLLTDGRWWHWFVKKGAEKHLSKEPFLSHDASAAPTAAAVSWYGAILNGSLDDLKDAAIEAIFADTARSWLRALGSGDEQLLNSIAGIEPFKSHWGHNKLVGQQALATGHLTKVWPAVFRGFEDFIRGSADPEPGGSKSEELGRSALDTGKAASAQEIPASESYGKWACRWRIGKGSDWQIAKNGKHLFAEVLQRLDVEFSNSPNAWYEAVWGRQPKWIAKDTNAKDLSSPMPLGHGYSCSEPPGNDYKKKRLEELNNLFAKVTGRQLHLEIDIEFGSNR